MSRFTAPLFNRPSPFGLSRVHPLSPPDTDVLEPQMNPSFPQPQHMTNHENEPSPVDNPFRRVSTLAYNIPASGTRDRSNQRASRWLVLVIPPSFLSQPNGNLGHTLASGPEARLSQGILMPLFPTLYTQLAAIAREFNFPSTTGLCLYMHVVEGGTLFLPRISDESWGILWSNHFEGNVVMNSPLPISGRIEFDIDLSKARWYGSWLSAPQKEPIPFPSAPSSYRHQHQDSKTTLADDIADGASTVVHQPKGLRAKHVPKKLSLVEHAVVGPLVSIPIPDSTAFPEPSSARNQFLSPIPQEMEPRTAEEKLQNRVKSWRDSASLTPMATHGQTSLDPVNMPTPVPNEDTSSGVVEQELNLCDYTWSVSSLGPPSEVESLASWSRVPSVHLDRRLVGSVCPTLSICTSLGPVDYDPFSPLPSEVHIRTPDVAMRMFEDVPMTPSTVTSWGPPSYPSSPTSISRAPSLDLGHRSRWSRPVTPSTATSWGPPEFYPPTPTASSHVGTPDAAQIAFDFDDEIGVPWKHSWSLFRPTSQSLNPVVPAFVYPFIVIYPNTASDSSLAERLKIEASRNSDIYTPCQATYPVFDIYPSVYPHFNLYPTFKRPIIREHDVLTRSKAAVTLAERSNTDGSKKSDINASWQTVLRHTTYPVFDMYPSIYPHFNLYPTVERSLTRERGASVNSKAPVKYPEFPNYPAFYPDFDTFFKRSNKALSPQQPELSTVKLTPSYPHIEIYPAVYPFLEIYPAVKITNVFKPTTRIQAPILRASSGLAPRTTKTRRRFGSRDEHIPPVPPLPRDLGNLKPLSPVSRLPLASFPSVHKAEKVVAPMVSRVKHTTAEQVSISRYPYLNIYPAVYPYIEIYPSTAGSMGGLAIEKLTLREVPLSSDSGHQSADIFASVQENPTSSYPYLQIYKASYPHFDLYPMMPGTTSNIPSKPPSLGVPPLNNAIGTGSLPPVSLVAGYPNIEIYKPAYPHFELYNSWSNRRMVIHRPRPVSTISELKPLDYTPSRRRVTDFQQSLNQSTVRPIGLPAHPASSTRSTSLRTPPNRSPAFVSSRFSRSVDFNGAKFPEQNTQLEPTLQPIERRPRRQSVLISERMKAFDSGR